MNELRAGLRAAADQIADYRDGLPVSRVSPVATRAEVRAALDRELPDGPTPLQQVIDELVALARRFADGLALIPGIQIVNEVVLNQVLVRVGDEQTTNRIERRLHDDGTLWLGATTWHGERLLRISISNWSTTEQDVGRSVEAIARARTAVLKEQT